jgi:hypothetical protein
VRLPAGPAPPDGENLVADATGWRLDESHMRDGLLRLSAPWRWHPSAAEKTVVLRPGTLYRIALDVRGPEGSAGNTLGAAIREPLLGHHSFDDDPLALLVYADQIGAAWRHFEWTFTTPDEVPAEVTFRVHTLSERPIEVRNVTLRASHPDRPVPLGDRLAPGARVYAEVAKLPALDPRAPPVVLYENLQWQPVGTRPTVAASSEEIERLKWHPGAWLADAGAGLPDVGLSVPEPPTRLLLFTTLPGLLLYSLLLATARRRRRSIP